jgi:hypothetical protein
MQIKPIIPGLENSQRFRVILNGVGFISTVQDTENMPFLSQRLAVHNTMAVVAREKIQSIATTIRVYNDSMQEESFEVQVDLI